MPKRLLLSLFTVMTASMVMAQTYISDLMVAGTEEDTGNYIQGELNRQGYTAYWTDLNVGARKWDIKLGYKTTTNRAEAITDLLVTNFSNPPASFEYNGKRYYKVTINTSWNFNGDLNRGAGGSDLYLYYTKDGNTSGEPVIRQLNLLIDNKIDETEVKGYTSNGSTYAAVDLNENTNTHDHSLYIEMVKDPMDISTPAHLRRFAQLVAGDYQDLNGRLTANIEFSGYGEMIGTSDKPYTGTFDGQGHFIRMSYNTTAENAAVFCNVGNCTIKNLITGGTIKTSAKYAGGIFGRAYPYKPTLINCVSQVWIESSINGDGSHGGICGFANGVTMTNCGFYGSIVGPNTYKCGGLIGWCEEAGNFKSCVVAPYEISLSGGLDAAFARSNATQNVDANTCFSTCNTTHNNNVTIVNNDAMKSGEICYRLNNKVSDGSQAWYQRLGGEFYPFPINDGYTVYYGYDRCFETPGYSNSPRLSTPLPHTMVTTGKCSVCGKQMMEADNDGYILINDLAGFNIFADMVNNGRGTNVKAKLTADLDLTGSNTMLGVSENIRFIGTFDGQGHLVTVDYNSADEGLALFHYVGNCSIMNLRTTGTIKTSKPYAGGIISHSNATTPNLTNCVSDVRIESGITGDGSHGGLVGITSWLNMTNCAFFGSIVGPNTGNCGGLVGWCDASGTITSCAVAPGEINLLNGLSAALARGAVKNISCENCYTTMSATENNNATVLDNGALTSGQLCFLLNGKKSDGTQVWYQKIGTDTYPLPFSAEGKTVYGEYWKCKDTEKQYGNTKDYDHSSPIDHTWNGGTTCSVCGETHQHLLGTDGYCSTGCGKQLLTQEGGAMVIGNSMQFKYFADMINRGVGLNTNAKLSDNIIVDNGVMIGSDTYAYSGTFDGQRHTITVDFRDIKTAGAGIFHNVGNATITDLITTGTITTSSTNAGGIVGGVSHTATQLTMSRCISSVTINSTFGGAAGHGGLVGISNGGSITCSAFCGSIISDNSTECGGLIGNSRYPTVITSCLFAPKEISNASIITSAVSGGIVSNVIATFCYTSYQGVGSEDLAIKRPSAALASGEFCYLLNLADDTKTLWYQKLATDYPASEAEAYPLPYEENGVKVYYGYYKCVPEMTFANHELADSPVPHTFQNKKCTVCGMADPTRKIINLTSDMVGITMENNAIYTVKTPSLDLTSTVVGGNALSVKPGETATIYIPKGNVLKVKGGDGHWQTPGGAAIYVPKNSTLIITGEGSLEATGGNAGDGGDGEVGTNAWSDGSAATVGPHHMTAGYGGRGGCGGGGAAAAIGGNGGRGANKTAQKIGKKKEREPDNYDESGEQGLPPNDGFAGEDMGTVYILSTSNVTTYCGISNAKGGSCPNTREAGVAELHGTRYYCGGAGGPGGGGGNGFKASCGIGGGGAGGQSGSSGGTGGFVWRGSFRKTYLHGAGGLGGAGGSKNGDSSTLTRTEWTNSDDKLFHGGDAGIITPYTPAPSNDGTLYVSNNARMSLVGRDVNGITDTVTAISWTVLLSGNGFTVPQKTVRVCYGVKPEKVKVPGDGILFFRGFFTKPTGGDKIFDSDGNPYGVWNLNGTTTLYAQWGTSYICNKEQYIAFADFVNSQGSDRNSKVYLLNDIDLTGCDKTIGTDEHPFNGTFDGQFCTLTLDRPIFNKVGSANITSIVVKGSVKNSQSVLANEVVSGANATFSKVVTCATMDATGNVNPAGILYQNNGITTFDGCGFMGSIALSGTYYAFCKNNGGTMTFKNCLVAPEPLSLSSGLSGQLNMYGGTASCTNCYVLGQREGWNIAQQTFTQIQDKGKLTGGQLCYQLNGNNANGAWFQNLNQEADSIPTILPTHRKVFCDNNRYHNRNSLMFDDWSCLNTIYTPNENTEINVSFNSYDASLGYSFVLATDKANTRTSAFFYGDSLYANCGVLEPDQVKTYPYDAYTLYMGHGKKYLDYYPDAGKSSTHLWAIDDGIVPKTFHGVDSIYFFGTSYIYECSIMENGRLVRNLLPAKRDTQIGFYDTQNDMFIPASTNTKLYLDADACTHPYIGAVRQGGVKYNRCNICGKKLYSEYYYLVRFESNADSPKSDVEAYNKVTGTMPDQVITKTGKLDSCSLIRPMHIFKGWKASDGRFIADGGELTPSEWSCDTLRLYAQWQPAYSVGGKLYKIPDDGIVPDLAIVDDGLNGFATAKTFKATKASYTITPATGKTIGTICLPFAVKPVGGIKLYPSGTVQNDTILLGQDVAQLPEGTLPGGTAAVYRLENPSDGNPITLSAANVTVTDSLATPTGSLLFQGTFFYTSLKCDDENVKRYYGIVGDKFYYVTSSIVLRPFRAFFYTAADGSSTTYAKDYDFYHINFGDDQTAIRHITSNADDDTNAPVYDLMGRRLSEKPQHGIFIQNGKKIIR